MRTILVAVVAAILGYFANPEQGATLFTSRLSADQKNRSDAAVRALTLHMAESDPSDVSTEGLLGMVWLWGGGALDARGERALSAFLATGAADSDNLQAYGRNMENTAVLDRATTLLSAICDAVIEQRGGPGAAEGYRSIRAKLQEHFGP
jgi:hypothetical protein